MEKHYSPDQSAKTEMLSCPPHPISPLRPTIGLEEGPKQGKRDNYHDMISKASEGQNRLDHCSDSSMVRLVAGWVRQKQF